MIDRKTNELMIAGFATVMALALVWLMVVDGYVQAFVDASVFQLICRSGLKVDPDTLQVT